MSVEPSPSRPEIEALRCSPRAASSRRLRRSRPRPTRSASCTRRPSATTRASGPRIARERVSWFTRFDKTLEWDLPFAKWFTGGELNVSYNCVDRHVERGLGDKVAYHWIGEPGDTRTITYADLQREVQKAANALKELGVEKGDRVAIYMPMIPELPIAMLACARLGAPAHGRLRRLLGRGAGRPHQRRPGEGRSSPPTAAGGGARPSGSSSSRRGARRDPDGRARPRRAPARRARSYMLEGRDVWWHDIVDRQSDHCPPVPVDSEHMLYLLYTSGTTAKPKGIIHTTAGYLAGHELHPRDDLRHQARRRVLVRRRHRLGDRPQLHRVRAARQRDDRHHVRGLARHARLGPLVADRRGLQGHRPVLRADGDPGVHEAGRGASRRSTTCRRCGSSARWASRSTPRPGSGTTTTSAAGGRPSSTRGGRPRPARSSSRRCPGSRRPSPAAPRSRSRASRPTSWTATATPVPLGGGGYLVLKRPWPAMLRGIYGDPDALQGDLLEPLPGDVLRGRRRQARRRRLLLAARPGRRRDERGRPPASARSRSNRPSSTTARWPRRRSSARTTP